MFVSLWSVKGGVGTTVSAASLALVLAQSSPEGVLLVDVAGDVPAVLGLPEPGGPGLAAWLGAGPTVAADALARLEVPVVDRLRLLPLGDTGPACTTAAPSPDRAEVLADLLALERRPVVVDCGLIARRTPRAPADDAVAITLAGAATHSWLVTRACYLALRRAVSAPLAPSGFVLVREGGRSLQARDLEAVLGVPMVADVPWDPSVARAVDAGLLAGRLPRGLASAVRRAA